jgi:hypothetical protein
LSTHRGPPLTNLDFLKRAFYFGHAPKLNRGTDITRLLKV